MAKVEQFFEFTVPTMNRVQFRRWFRINPETFEQLADALEDEDYVRSSGRRLIQFQKRLAMLLAYLGSHSPSFQYVSKNCLPKCQYALNANISKHVVFDLQLSTTIWSY